MFQPLSEKFIDLKKYKLLHMHHSLNEPLVSLKGGESPEAAKAFLMTLQSETHLALHVVGLYFPDTGKQVLYASEPFQVELFSESFDEAQAFAEQMGFLLDNMKYETLNPQEKEHLVRGVPFFYESHELYLKSLGQTEIQRRRGRSEEFKRDQSLDTSKVFLEQYLRILSML